VPNTRGGETFIERFARRLQYVVFLYQLKNHRQVTQIWLATETSKQLGLKQSLASETARRWLAGLSVPDSETIQAIALVLDCDPGWLAYGDHSKAPPPGKPDDVFADGGDVPARKRVDDIPTRSRKKNTEPVERPSAKKKRRPA
jgi:hypothetical protein